MAAADVAYGGYSVRLLPACALDYLHVERWTVDHVCFWVGFTTKCLVPYVQTFREWGIDGATLLQIDKDMASLLVPDNVVNRKQLLISVKQLKEDINLAKSYTGRRIRMNEYFEQNEFTVTSEECIIELTADVRYLRAKMCCGHVISPEALYQYSRDVLFKADVTDITCPLDECKAVWDFMTCMCIGSFSAKEMEDMSCRAQLNAAVSEYGDAKLCKNCSEIITRPPYLGKNADVQCSQCRTRFCWDCDAEWDARNGKCSDRCDPLEVRNAILANCPIKAPKYCDHARMPDTRACPNPDCQALIFHTHACKHMDCLACGLKFCFICLKPKINGEWQCPGISVDCGMAPRQVLT